MTTANVQCGLSDDATKKYALVTMCQRGKESDVILQPPQTGKRVQPALAFTTAVTRPEEFTVEAVQPVTQDDYPKVKETFKK